MNTYKIHGSLLHCRYFFESSRTGRHRDCPDNAFSQQICSVRGSERGRQAIKRQASGGYTSDASYTADGVPLSITTVCCHPLITIGSAQNVVHARYQRQIIPCAAVLLMTSLALMLDTKFGNLRLANADTEPSSSSSRRRPAAVAGCRCRQCLHRAVVIEGGHHGCPPSSSPNWFCNASTW